MRSSFKVGVRREPMSWFYFLLIANEQKESPKKILFLYLFLLIEHDRPEERKKEFHSYAELCWVTLVDRWCTYTQSFATHVVIYRSFCVFRLFFSLCFIYFLVVLALVQLLQIWKMCMLTHTPRRFCCSHHQPKSPKDRPRLLYSVIRNDVMRTLQLLLFPCVLVAPPDHPMKKAREEPRTQENAANQTNNLLFFLVVLFYLYKTHFHRMSESKLALHYFWGYKRW